MKPISLQIKENKNLSHFVTRIYYEEKKIENESEARSLGEEENTDIVIWGSFGMTGVVSLHFLILNKINPYLSNSEGLTKFSKQKITNLGSFKILISRKLDSYIKAVLYFFLGLIFYSLEDYKNAEKKLIESLDETNKLVELETKGFKGFLNQIREKLFSTIKIEDILLNKNKIYFYLGNTYCFLDEYENGFKYFGKVREIDEPYILLYNRGCAYEKVYGVTEDCFLYYEEALKYKPDFPDALNNLGVLYYEKKNIEKAKEYFQTAVNLKLNLIDPYLNLISILLTQKRDFQAKEIVHSAPKEMQADLEKFYNEMINEKPDTSTILVWEEDLPTEKKIKEAKSRIESNPNNWVNYYLLGIAYYEAGQYEEALDISKQSLFYPKGDAEEATVLGLIGNIYANKGNADLALKYFNEALEIQLGKLGERHPYVAATYVNIGGVYGSKGEYDKAIEYYEKALEIQLEKLGERHPYVAATYNNIGGVYLSKGEYDKAIEYYKKALEIRLEKLGERHPDVATTYNNIGAAYEESKGEYDKAIEYYKKALEIRLEKLGERHPDVATTYNNIGAAYGSKGDYDKAIEYYEKALEIQLEKLGERHPYVATTYFNIGRVYGSKGEYDKAIEYYEKALEIQIEKFGERHPFVAATYNSIGGAYYSKGENDKAIEYYEKALEIRIEKFGERHPFVAATYNSVGGAYYSKGENDKAIEYYEKAIEIQFEKLGERHPDVATTYNNIGGAYFENGEAGLAVGYFKKALEIIQSLYGTNHPNYTHIKDGYDASRIIVAVQEMETNRKPFEDLLTELGKERVLGILKQLGYDV